MRIGVEEFIRAKLNDGDPDMERLPSPHSKSP
jgi:hypothetical protein